MRVISAAALMLVLSVVCPASAAPQIQPRTSEKTGSSSAAPAIRNPDYILNRYVKVIGGKAAWERLHSRTSLGTIDLPAMNLSGTVMIHEKAPDKALISVILAGSAFRQGFDGTTAWSDDPKNGLQIKSGAELLEAQRDADFYHPLDLRKLYKKFEVSGIEKIEGHDAYVVEADPPEGGADKLYFDVASGLVVRVISQHHTGDQVSTFTEDLGDYREVDGIKLPFTIHQSGGEMSFTIKFDRVQHNVDLDDSEFVKPAAQ